MSIESFKDGYFEKNIKTMTREVLIFIFLLGWVFPAAAQETPFVIHQIVGHPAKVNEVFAITSSYGVLKSEDAGLTWKTASHGLKSFTHHALAITPTTSPRLYVGGWAGGISRSDDGGANWVEMNDQLGNTAVDAIAVDPGAPDRLYVATSTQFYRSDDLGKGWVLFEEGLPPFPDEIKFKSLVFAPGAPKVLWYGNSQGLFYRPVDAPAWSAEEKFREVRVSALAYDEKNRRLWVGTLAKGLFIGENQGKKWSEIGIEKGLWINQIALDPIDPQIVYVATRGKGIFKSTDGGKSWTPSNNGFDEQDIRSLAVHPLNRSLLFGGTTSNGIFRSADGGAHWRPVQPMPARDMAQLIALLSIPVVSFENRPAVPDAFTKCNGCHGWTELWLNRKQTYWRVPANRRDWKYTVGRMAKRAKLTKEEESTIVQFLTSHSGQNDDPPSDKKNEKAPQ